MAPLTIDKPRSPADWAEMREICCETAARPIPAEQRDAFGETWIGPYERRAPQWAYVARDERGGVAGYLTGCVSSARFYALLALVGPRPVLGANLRFGARALLRLLWRYPAHLHVNVRERHRGGVGRALVERYEKDAAAAGARGVHLFCGARPLGFYEKLGYERLAEIRYGAVPLYALGKRLR